MWLRQSTAGQEILLGRFVDSTDGDTEETALIIANTDIKLWKEGATTLANKNSGGATHISNGLYYCVLDATDTNTLGKLEVNVHVTGALPVRREYDVVPAMIYDSIILGTDRLDTNVTHVADTAQTANDNGADINTLLTRIVGTLAAGTHNPQSGDTYALASGGTGFNALAGYIDTEIGTIITNLATAQSDLDTITGTNGVLIDDTEAAALVDAIWDEPLTAHTTNQTPGKVLKGISEGWISAEGAVNDASPTASSFVCDLTSARDDFYKDAVLVFISEVTGDTVKGVGRSISGYTAATNTLTFDEPFPAAPSNTDGFIVLAGHTHSISEIQSGLATEAKQDTAQTSINAIAGYLDTEIAAILEDTGTTIPALIAALNNITVADILTTQMTESYAADGVAPTLTQALMLIMQRLTEFSISGTTITAKKLDGTTTAATFTMDSDTAPTSSTRAT